MNFIVIVTILIIGVVYGEIDSKPFGNLTEKNEVRVELKEAISRLICSDTGYCCPYQLAPEQEAFAIRKVNELGKCLNATVDRFIDLADDDLVRTDFRNVDNIRKYVGPVCEVFDNAFACIRNVESALNMCLSVREMIFKNKIFSIAPLIHTSMCLNNGTVIADILEHEDGPQCLSITADWIGKSGASELLFRDTTDLFGTESDCREFNTVRQDTYAQLGECSPSVLSMITEISSRFCEGTKCDRFINDLRCN